MGKIIKENGKIWLVELECGKHFRKTFIGTYEEKEDDIIEIVEKEDDIIEIKPKKTNKKTKKE